MKKLTNYKGETLYLVLLNETLLKSITDDKKSFKIRTTAKFVWADEDLMCEAFCDGLFGVKNGLSEDKDCLEAFTTYHAVNPDPIVSKTIIEEDRYDG